VIRERPCGIRIARRSLCIVLMAAGYPLGTGVGGSVSPLLLAYFDWPAIFVFGVS